MRVRCAGCVLMDGGIALMHRRNVKKQEGTTKPYGEYWVFPGGGLEETDSSKEEGAAREVKEEFGIDIKVEDILIERHIDDLDEYLFKCSYVGGTFGTGTGPEFSGDPKYADRGEYIPEIVPLNKIKDIRLIPEEFKEKLVELIDKNVI